MMQSKFGLKPKDQAGTYRHQYPSWFDLVALPSHYRVPDFSKFSRLDDVSTMEHVSRYIAQLGEASVEEAHLV